MWLTRGTSEARGPHVIVKYRNFCRNGLGSPRQYEPRTPSRSFVKSQPPKKVADEYFGRRPMDDVVNHVQEIKVSLHKTTITDPSLASQRRSGRVHSNPTSINGNGGRAPYPLSVPSASPRALLTPRSSPPLPPCDRAQSPPFEKP